MTDAQRLALARQEWDKTSPSDRYDKWTFLRGEWAANHGHFLLEMAEKALEADAGWRRYRQVVDAARQWRAAECDCGGQGSHEEACPALRSNVALVVAVDALDAAERPEAGKETT